MQWLHWSDHQCQWLRSPSQKNNVGDESSKWGGRGKNKSTINLWQFFKKFHLPLMWWLWSDHQRLGSQKKQQCWDARHVRKKETTTNGAKAETICIPGNLAMVAMPQIETKNKDKNKKQSTSWLAASTWKKQNKQNDRLSRFLSSMILMHTFCFQPYPVGPTVALPGIIGTTTLLQ